MSRTIAFALRRGGNALLVWRRSAGPGSAGIRLTLDDRLRHGWRGRFRGNADTHNRGRATHRRDDGPGSAMPAQQLRRVNLIERQRDHSESEAVSCARAPQRPVATGSSLLPVTATPQPLASAITHPSCRPQASAASVTPLKSATASMGRLLRPGLRACGNSCRRRIDYPDLRGGPERVASSAVTFIRITVSSDQMGGVPCIRGLRIPVATVVYMVGRHERCGDRRGVPRSRAR